MGLILQQTQWYCSTPSAEFGCAGSSFKQHDLKYEYCEWNGCFPGDSWRRHYVLPIPQVKFTVLKTLYGGCALL